MSKDNLESLIQRSGNVTDMLRNSQIGAYVYPVVPNEYSNWRDEQRAWRDSAVLFDQSHHMVNVYIEGPDALKMISNLAFNPFAKFPVDRAKHFAPCSYDGFIIGDGILFHLAQNQLEYVGRAPAANWIEFQAATGGYNVKATRDERSPGNPGGKPVIRTQYRFQVQGPNATEILNKLNGGPIPEIKFFNMGYIKINGKQVRALRHGMAGAPGLEVWGPYEEREDIRAAIIEAGKDFGMVQVGNRAYATNTLESGWIPSPLPAVYTGDKMKAYREWLPLSSYEASGSVGGSFYSKNIEDYYMTPYALGYGSFVKFDHDYIGKEAIQRQSTQPHRRKVTFAWNKEDVLKVMASMFEEGAPYKYIDIPLSNYTSASYDKIVGKGGKAVGFSMFAGYSYNERSMLSLGVVDPDITEGTELTLVWGEDNGGSKKPTVERHRQAEIRVVVSSVPYSKVVRETYADGWRSTGKL